MIIIRLVLKYVNNYIYKLIILDLIRNIWYDDFCLYFFVLVWEILIKLGCNWCFFVSKYGVVFFFCVIRIFGRNEVNVFKKSFIFLNEIMFIFFENRW